MPQNALKPCKRLNFFAKYDKIYPNFIIVQLKTGGLFDMEFDISAAFLSFINLFLLPIIGLRIYLRRNSGLRNSRLDILYGYALIAVLNILLTHILTFIIKAVTSYTVAVGMVKYTAAALLSCIALPFIIEAVRAFFKLEVSISLRQKSGDENE